MANGEKFDIFFVYGNHNNQSDVLIDYFYLIKSFVQYSLNKELKTSPTLVAGSWNIIIEAMDENWIRQMELVRRTRGTRVICLTTEFVTGNTFNLFKENKVSRQIEIVTEKANSNLLIEAKKENPSNSFIQNILERIFTLKILGFPFRWGKAIFRASNLLARVNMIEDHIRTIRTNIEDQGDSDKEDWAIEETHYEKNYYFKARYKGFVNALPCIDMIWCNTPDQIEGYRNLLFQFGYEDVPLWYFPLQPYSRTEFFPWNLNVNQDIDILFSGTITPYRRKVLSFFERKRLNVVYSEPHIPSFVREDLLFRSKICLHIPPNPDWKYSSPTRLHSLIMKRKCVVAKTASCFCFQDEFVKTSESDKLFEAVRELLTSENFNSIGEENYKNYLSVSESRAPKIKEEFLRFIRGIEV